MSLETTPTHPAADSYVTLAEAEAYFTNRSDVADWAALSNDQKEAVLKLATKHIDSLRFRDFKFFRQAQWGRDMQMLQFPRNTEDARNGAVTSATNNGIVCLALANYDNQPDDFWNNGAVVITDGTGKGQTRKVSDFVSATGAVTITSNWTTNPDSSSQFYIIRKIPDKVKFATFEQALYIVNGGGERQKMQSEGVKSFSIGDLSETFVEGGGNAGKIAVSNEAKGFLKGLWTVAGSFSV